ncbi:DUF342 domain-containing protein [bacterium]|nr:DUF342 domain-containing protein [bacterium]
MKPIPEKQIEQIEEKLAKVLEDMKEAGGKFDVDSEFEELMFSKNETPDVAVDDIRAMTRRFGPRLMQLLGFPPANGTCRLRILEDGLQAELDVDPPAGDGKPAAVEDVRRLIGEKGVVAGIDQDAIEKAVEQGRTEPARGVIIARGTPAVSSKDGWIELISTPREGERNLTAAASLDISAVIKDQAIARLVPPSPGTPGQDVLGREIPVMAGMPVVADLGERVSFDANAGIFYAKESGRVVILKNFIDIEKLLEIKQDIDISVGHVTFPGELVIRGWVRAGMNVEAEKDIVIEGGVEAAGVKSTDGSIFISKGVQGSQIAMIEAAWDVNAKFIEQATVMAGGVVKTQNAIRSELAGGEAVLVCEGKGVVIGGRIYAGRRVEVRELGAGSGEPTVVQLGMTPENLTALAKLKLRKQVTQKASADAEQAISRLGLSAEALQSKSLTDEGRNLLKLTKTLIVLQHRCRKVQDEETAFLESMKTKTNGELDVRGKVHPGVKILIGHSTYQVQEAMSWVRFRYDPEKRRIKAIPLG